MQIKKDRPKYLNLFKIRLPVTGVASIFHRISGVILFIAIPFSLYLFALSLRSPAGYSEALSYLDSIGVQVFGLAVVWALAHHFFAGIRYLFLDLDIGVELKPARITAWLTIIVAFLILFYVAVRMIL